MRVEKVFITPLVSQGAYGDEIDISDFVENSGISKIERSIDSTNYSIGVYRFSDVKLKCQNSFGTFNENDSRSIFPYERDRAKVRIIAQKIDAVTHVITDQLQFEGIINDDVTRINMASKTISLTVFSKDSVLRTTQITQGLIANGTDAKTALFTILNQESITNLLTVSLVNINPDYNFIIDAGNELDSISVREGIDIIMRASNSVLLIESDTIYIQTREKSSPKTFELRGRGELSNNANIISVINYNNGKQRTFNSILINRTILVEDRPSVARYGLKQLKLSFDLVTNIDTLQVIAQNIVNEFRYPKIELDIRVPSDVVEDIDLLDLVKIDAPFLRVLNPGNFFPVLGVFVLGDSITPLPLIKGDVQILRHLKFKVISIQDDPKVFQKNIRIRQFGKLTNDGVF